MGTTAFILMDQNKYTTEKLLADSIVAALNCDAILNFHNTKNCSKDGRFLSTTLNISYKLGRKNNYSFIYYVDATDNPNIEFYYNEDVRLNPNKKFCNVGCIEEVFGNEELIFYFIYEYLKLNPDDYFWVTDYDWVYSWENVKKLKSLPHDPEWCYKDPNANS